MVQAIQVAGALAILGAYVAGQTGIWAYGAVTYLAVNAAGGGVLAVVAFAGSDWGFALLEGAWSVTSLIGLLRREAARG